MSLNLETHAEKERKKVESLERTYEKVKNLSNKELSEILLNDYNENLLCICGGLFEEGRTRICYVALKEALKRS